MTYVQVYHRCDMQLRVEMINQLVVVGCLEIYTLGRYCQRLLHFSVYTIRKNKELVHA